MSLAAHVAVHNLRVDEVTSEVLRALDEDGVACILLKGRSTVEWLFADEPRRYQDCDLLVPAAALGAAERVLEGLGFSPQMEQTKMPAWWREHAVEWRHPDRFAAVDLHRTMSGVGVDDRRLWDVLSADTETMTIGGFPSTVLPVPGRALLLVLNRAGDGFDNGDLARAVEQAGERTWWRAAELARELDATEAFAAGLRLVPRGEALAEALGLPRPRSVDAELRRARAPLQALTIDRLARASGARERVVIVARKLLPPRTYMRYWSHQTRRGRGPLLLAYVHRPLWVARRVPRAVRAWRRARREVQAGPRDPV